MWKPVKKISSKSSKQYQNTQKNSCSWEVSDSAAHLLCIRYRGGDGKAELVRVNRGGRDKVWIEILLLVHGYWCQSWSMAFCVAGNTSTPLPVKLSCPRDFNKTKQKQTSAGWQQRLTFSPVVRTTTAFTIAVCFVVVLSRSACVCSRSSGCTPPGR